MVVDNDFFGVWILASVLCENASHAVVDVRQSAELLVVLQELVRVYLMNEHFKRDVRVDGVSHFDDLEKPVARGVLVVVLSINHVDDVVAALHNALLGWLRQVLRISVAREVLDGEGYMRVVVNHYVGVISL